MAYKKEELPTSMMKWAAFVRARRVSLPEVENHSEGPPDSECRQDAKYDLAVVWCLATLLDSGFPVPSLEEFPTGNELSHPLAFPSVTTHRVPMTQSPEWPPWKGGDVL